MSKSRQRCHNLSRGVLSNLEKKKVGFARFDIGGKRVVRQNCCIIITIFSLDPAILKYVAMEVQFGR